MSMNAIIAVNPQQMQEAQATTAGWIETKLAGARKELSLAEEVYNSLHRNKLRSTAASSQINKARRRIVFYEKVQAALAAGYYIIPPFDIQLFAIRTDRHSPHNSDHGTSKWTSDQTARKLPLGEGHYVDPDAVREQVSTKNEKNHDGTTREVALYANTEWRDIEMPIKALKPQVIEETGRALALKIFDALGIAPAYRAADPIIAGQILRPDGGALTFFIAWWLDEQDL